MKRHRFAWVTILPATWLLVCTLTAGLQKVFHGLPSIGFLAHAQRFSEAATTGKILAPAKTMEEMHRVIFNDYVDATLAALFVAVVLAMVVYGVISIRKALGTSRVTAIEVGGPDDQGYLRLIEKYLGPIPLAPGFTCDDLLNRLRGISPADLQGLINTAKRMAMNRMDAGDEALPPLIWGDFEQALERTRSRM